MNELSLLIWYIYPLTCDAPVVTEVRRKSIVHVVNTLPLTGETSVGAMILGSSPTFTTLCIPVESPRSLTANHEYV